MAQGKGTAPDAGRTAGLRRSLLAWYRRHARPLPWRAAKDPYATLVSEFMLQQTRVDVALPYYGRWMARWPTAGALAAADEEDVLRMWSGLGYYARARNLHAAARAIVEGHAGKVPEDVDELRALPGIGPYTAAAVASIAYGRRVAAVDGNVVRVLARLDALAGATADPQLRRRVQQRADELVPAAAPGDWNQALMDLGATLCTPRAPRCGECPVAAHCKAREAGIQASIPAPRVKAMARRETWHVAVVRRQGKILLTPPPGNLLRGTWTLPMAKGRDELRRMVADAAGTVPRLGGRPAQVEHAFSHLEWTLHVHRVEAAAAPSPTRQRPQSNPKGRWVSEADLPGEALSSAVRKALRAAAVPA